MLKIWSNTRTYNEAFLMDKKNTTFFKPIRLLIVYFIAVLLSALAGIQFFGTSRDVENYYIFFWNVSGYYDGRFEPLFVHFSIVIKSITENFAFYIFIITLISISLKLYVLHKYKYFYFSLLCYLLILFPLHELTQYRISIALAFVYLSYYLLSFQKNKFLALIVFSISPLFHFSTIALLPIFLFWSKLTTLSVLKFTFIAVAILALYAGKYIIVSTVGVINPTVFGAVDVPTILNARNIVFFSLVIIGMIGWKTIPVNIRPFFFVSCYGFVLWFLFFDFPVFAQRLFEMTFMSYFIWVGFLRGLLLYMSQFLLLVLALYILYLVVVIDPLFV